MPAPSAYQLDCSQPILASSNTARTEVAPQRASSPCWRVQGLVRRDKRSRPAHRTAPAATSGAAGAAIRTIRRTDRGQQSNRRARPNHRTRVSLRPPSRCRRRQGMGSPVRRAGRAHQIPTRPPQRHSPSRTPTCRLARVSHCELRLGAADAAGTAASETLHLHSAAPAARQTRGFGLPGQLGWQEQPTALALEAARHARRPQAGSRDAVEYRRVRGSAT